MMSSWSGCECTFLSSETHIQLYTSLFSLHVVFLNQTFSLLVFFDLHRVPALQVQVFFPSQCLCVPERKRTRFPSSTLLAVFFFSTLICSSSCWTWLCPSPPFLPLFFPSAPPTHSPSHPHPQPHFSSARRIILHLHSLSSILLPRAARWGFVAPPGAAPGVHNNVTDSARARAAGSLDSSLHVNGSCICLNACRAL